MPKQQPTCKDLQSLKSLTTMAHCKALWHASGSRIPLAPPLHAGRGYLKVSEYSSESSLYKPQAENLHRLVQLGFCLLSPATPCAFSTSTAEDPPNLWSSFWSSGRGQLQGWGASRCSPAAWVKVYFACAGTLLDKTLYKRTRISHQAHILVGHNGLFISVFTSHGFLHIEDIFISHRMPKPLGNI